MNNVEIKISIKRGKNEIEFNQKYEKYVCREDPDFDVDSSILIEAIDKIKEAL